MKRYLITYEEYDHVLAMLGHDIEHKHYENVGVVSVDLYLEEAQGLLEAGLIVEENTQAELLSTPVPFNPSYGIPPQNLAYYYPNNPFAAGFAGQGVKVAIIDTGCSDLSAAAIPGITRLDFTGLGPGDDNGHGSKGCLTVGQQLNFSPPYEAELYGMAPHCSLYSMRAIEGGIDAFVAAIDYSIAHGMHIINLSVSLGNPASVATAIAAAIAAGIIVVCASGNSFNSNMTYPAQLPGTLAISSIFTITGELFGSYETDDGHIKVTVVNYNGGAAQTFISGTSGAAFTMSGLLALYKQKYPGLNSARAINLLQRRALEMDGYVYDNSADSTTLGVLLNYPTGAGFTAPLNS